LPEEQDDFDAQDCFIPRQAEGSMSQIAGSSPIFGAGGSSLFAAGS
jgi:hypothetical protein